MAGSRVIAVYTARIRLLIGIPLLFLVPPPANGWDTNPHRLITRAALRTLPAPLRNRLGPELQPLVDIYCIYPDRYEEMERYGFVRKSPGPRSASEIRIYCVRPDGQPIHGATGDREADIVSLAYLLERAATHFSARRPRQAAQYLGVLSHFIADSLSPPHAVSAGQLRELTPPAAREKRPGIHAIIERSIPEFDLGRRSPRRLGGDLMTATKAIVDQCYEGAGRNRAGLACMVKAASEKDEATLNVYRIRAGKRAAEILADVLATVLRLVPGA